VASCRYPPCGVRGYGPSRGVRFGQISSTDYLANVEKQILVIIQIEHIDAVNQIDAILEVPGFDSVVTGPNDLAATMGHGGQSGHPDVVAAIQSVYKATIAKGIPVGHSIAYDPENLDRWLELGLSWIAVDQDWITLYRVASQICEEVRRKSRQS